MIPLDTLAYWNVYLLDLSKSLILQHGIRFINLRHGLLFIGLLEVVRYTCFIELDLYSTLNEGYNLSIVLRYIYIYIYQVHEVQERKHGYECP